MEQKLKTTAIYWNLLWLVSFPLVGYHLAFLKQQCPEANACNHGHGCRSRIIMFAVTDHAILVMDRSLSAPKWPVIGTNHNCQVPALRL